MPWIWEGQVGNCRIKKACASRVSSVDAGAFRGADYVCGLTYSRLTYPHLWSRLIWQTHHVLIAGTRWNHGVAVFVSTHANVHQHGALVGQHLINGSR